MKPHILIPLLVVCVGLPVVAMGTYYVCDNFPTAEGMRKREVQYKEDIRREAERIKEERRLARERAEEERRQRELAEKRAEEEKRRKEEEERRREKEKAEEERRLAEERAEKEKQLAAQKKAEAQKSAKVAIKGISINLPYEQLKQELANKFGGIRGTSDKVPATQTVSKQPFIYFDYDMLSSKTTYIYFNEQTAFGGSVDLYPSCVCITFYDITQGRKYEKELQKQYGDATDEYETHYANIAGLTEVCDVTTRVMNDGIIHFVECHQRVGGSGGIRSDCCYVWYFGTSIRDYYIKKKGQVQREEEKQKKQEEERERKLRARDAEGI